MFLCEYVDFDVETNTDLLEAGLPVGDREGRGMTTWAVMANSGEPVVGAEVVSESMDSMLTPFWERYWETSWMIPSWSAPWTSIR